MANKDAPDGHVFICTACGKRSRDLYGFRAVSYGWDVSCTLRAALVREDRLKIEDGLVVFVAPDDAPPVR